MKFRMCVAIGVCAARLCSGQIAGPMAGVVLDPQNHLVPVHGVFGTLLRAEPVALPAELEGAPLSASFSDTSGLLKSATAWVVTDGAGQMQNSVQSSGAGPAMASFAADGSLQWFCAGACTTLETTAGERISTANAGGNVVGLGVTATDRIPILTASGAQLWSGSFSVTDQTVSNQIAVSGVTPAIAFNGGWLTTSPAGLIWNAPSGATTNIAISQPVQSLQASSSRTVCINGRWMLNAALQVLEIPVKPHDPPAKVRGGPAVVAR